MTKGGSNISNHRVNSDTVNGGDSDILPPQKAENFRDFAYKNAIQKSR
jgi:hypothetical protein